MAKKILILDDDADFNVLLTDVFAQADYDVTSLEDPKKALDAFAKNDFDLIVTDHRMPGITGAEFVRKAKKEKPEVPIIMVSGYLDNDTIRDLIREGVVGIFLKPLNIFSLLKKTSEILQGKVKTNGGNNRSGKRQLPFEFKTFPCDASASHDFARKLYSMRTFKSNLLVIGEKGSPFQSICEDLVGFMPPEEDALIIVNQEDFNPQTFIDTIKEKEALGKSRLTFAILDTEGLGEHEKSAIFSLSKRLGDYAEVKAQTRFIFCLTKDLDSLYESGSVDENLYIFLGTNEIQVPPLRKCVEDIVYLAEQFLINEGSKGDIGVISQIEEEGREYLKEQEWPGNYEELKTTVLLALSNAEGPIISIEDLRYAYEYKAARPVKIRARPMRDHLKQMKGEFIRSVLTLCEGDTEKAAMILDADPDHVINYQ